MSVDMKKMTPAQTKAGHHAQAVRGAVLHVARGVLAEGREDVSELAVEADSEGITPTTVYEVPFKVRDFPMMPGEEPNRRVQKLPLRMTTGAAPT